MNWHEVTKSGSCVYHVEQYQFHEWEFRTRLLNKASGDEGRRAWRNPVGFVNLAAEDWESIYDVAYNAQEGDDEEPHTDPADWYYDDDEHEAKAHYAQEQDTSSSKEAWNEYNAYVTDEFSKKCVEDYVELAELECVACLFDVLGSNCFEDPSSRSDFIQSGTAAYLANGKGKK